MGETRKDFLSFFPFPLGLLLRVQFNHLLVGRHLGLATVMCSRSAADGMSVAREEVPTSHQPNVSRKSVGQRGEMRQSLSC